MSPKGIHCPNPICKSTDIRSVNRYRPISGVRVRYFICNVCTNRFKTIERIGGPIQGRKPTGPGKQS